MRHPLMFWAWIVTAAIAALSTQLSYALLALVFLISPMLALATLAMVGLEARDVMRPAWAWPYRIVMALLAIVAGVGLAGTSARISGMQLHNAPIAFLFFGTLVFAWRAFVQPTPRRAAAPAAFVHVAWLPLVIVDAMAEWGRPTLEGWQLDLVWMSGAAILALSGVAAMLASGGFRENEHDRIAPAATIRR